MIITTQTDYCYCCTIISVSAALDRNQKSRLKTIPTFHIFLPTTNHVAMSELLLSHSCACVCGDIFGGSQSYIHYELFHVDIDTDDGGR